MAIYTPDAKDVVLQKKLRGVKIRRARTRAGLSEKEVAEALGITTEEMTDIEFGRRETTLPQLEVMSLFFNVPVAYFLTDLPIEESDHGQYPSHEAIALRERAIGVLLRQARIEAGNSQEELAQTLGLDLERVADYELGKAEIPMGQLEAVADYLNVSLDYFLDQGLETERFINGRGVTLEEITSFTELPEDVRDFIVNPANTLYIKIAMNLSELSAETLRTLAEGLLEVTY